MIQKHLNYVLIVILCIFSLGCEKDATSSGGKVELYLVDTFSTIGNSSQIDEATIKTKTLPLIEYSDFLSYNPTSYTFALSDKARSVIKDMELSVHGVPFAIKANNAFIYSGYFWPSISSTSCDWLVIDPLMTYSENAIEVRLGYPGLLSGMEIPDKRNDSRIINIFKDDNKLASGWHFN
ncbi:hypothetical protein [Labilibacter marinus]|uniref:hypothetical protein n=1 Tax=Labilibacter marinus TaxID=1477105 RepID=UPI000831E088|nr:hypothetical protein [Labilibacter marinus]